MKLGFQVLYLNSQKYFHNNKQHTEKDWMGGYWYIWYKKETTTWWMGYEGQFNNRDDGFCKLETTGKKYKN